MPRRPNNVEAGYEPTAIRAGWIVALDRQLRWADLPRSYRLLSAVLHAVDDRPEGATRRAGVDVGAFLQRVGTGFMPDRLDNPKGAVLVVLDVLDDLIGDPNLEAIRDALTASADAVSLHPATIKWSRFRGSFEKEHVR